jgi:hypothetical protein
MQVNRFNFHRVSEAKDSAQRDLLDIIAYRLISDSLEMVSDSVLERLFQLRSSAQGQNTDTLQGYAASDSALYHYAQSILTEYKKITPVSEEVPLEGEMHYPTFQILSTHPLPAFRHLKAWIDASLKIEFGLIAVEMSLSGRILWDEADLKTFLEKHLVRYGAYSILTGYWEPVSDAVHSVLENKMTLLAATIEMDGRIYAKKTNKQVHQLIFGNVQHSPEQKGNQRHRKTP